MALGPGLRPRSGRSAGAPHGPHVRPARPPVRPVRPVVLSLFVTLGGGWGGVLHQPACQPTQSWGQRSQLVDATVTGPGLPCARGVSRVLWASEQVSPT